MNMKGNENDWAIVFAVILLICLLICIGCFFYIIHINNFYKLYIFSISFFNLIILFGVWIRSEAVSYDFKEYMNGDSYNDLDSSNKFLFIMVYLCLIILTFLIIFALFMKKKLKNKNKR